MTNQQTPLLVFFQVIDENGLDRGSPFPAHESFRHCDITDRISFSAPGKVEGWEEWPEGTFLVQEREWRTRRFGVGESFAVEVTLIVFIRLE